MFSKLGLSSDNSDKANRNKKEKNNEASPSKSHMAKSVKVKSSQDEELQKMQQHLAKRRHSTSKLLSGPSPIVKCGLPAAQNFEAMNSANDPGNIFLRWEKRPSNILVVKKIGEDPYVLKAFLEAVLFLRHELEKNVYVEESAVKSNHPILSENKKFEKIRSSLKIFDRKADNSEIEFIVCVGGDGTLLHVSLQFQCSMPPVLAFAGGSLGFLTSFKPEEGVKSAIQSAINGNCHLLLRSRIKCVICDKDSVCSFISHARKINKSHSDFQYLALNDVVITRKGPFLSSLEIYVDGKYVTNLQGDGLIISTATGSTGYSLAAGSSIIHPSIPALLLTPICPHSLSFRPVVIPAGCDVTITLAQDARGDALISIDGRIQRDFSQGDTVRLTTSVYPLPSICRQDPVSDWFDSLKAGLFWNHRPIQKPLDPVAKEFLDASSSYSQVQESLYDEEISNGGEN